MIDTKNVNKDEMIYYIMNDKIYSAIIMEVEKFDDTYHCCTIMDEDNNRFTIVLTKDICIYNNKKEAESVLAKLILNSL